ncbi:MAG TPA: PilN domain-containing protein [Pirellulales bacterium]|jgi:Tfp pilus assembly protein PilN|nr:PilN domain-containing protein [Pirellulales bacterium]
MPDIDFLPNSYREQTVHRKANVWRLLIGGGFAAALVCSFLYQQVLYRQTARQLDELKPEYEQAEALSLKMAAMQSELKSATKQAELFTYLRHPWPRTQLLTAALSRLPDCVTLREIHILRRSNSTSDSPAARLGGKKQDDAEAKKLEPAERDLRQLRDETISRETILVLSGITSDTAALQRYLVTLGEAKLFAKVELTSLEANQEERQRTWRFSAQLGVRPGYGQPGGPEPVSKKGISPIKSTATLPANSAPLHSPT